MSAMAAPGRPAARMDRGGVGPDRAGAGDRACRNTRPARVRRLVLRPAAGARGAAVVVRQQPGLTTAVSGGRRGGGGQPQHRPRLPPSGRRHPCPSRQRPRRGRPDPGGPGRDRRSGRPRDRGRVSGKSSCSPPAYCCSATGCSRSTGRRPASGASACWRARSTR